MTKAEVPAPTVIPIDDPDDLRVAAYRDIRERDLAGRQGRFVAEGRVVLSVLFAARRFEVESVLILENRLAGLSDVLANCPAGAPIYVASSAVIDRIAGFHLHRGILAIGRKRQDDTAEALVAALPERSLVVGLIGIANHDNIGAIFRNAAAFGVDAILLDETSCDPLYRKAIRVSVGNALRIPFARTGSGETMTQLLRGSGFRMLALSPGAETELGDADDAPRMALVFGTEGEGLPENLLSTIETARIAMVDGFDSLNVAAASAIALHHLMRKRPG